jgi:hypothetical protein
MPSARCGGWRGTFRWWRPSGAGHLEDTQGPVEPFSALRLTGLHVDQIHHFPDGSDRLVGMHDARHYDVTVVLTRDVDTALAGWRMATRIAALGLLALVAVACAWVLLRRRGGPVA